MATQVERIDAQAERIEELEHELTEREEEVEQQATRITELEDKLEQYTGIASDIRAIADDLPEEEDE
jgi:uncharacterized coiled-coil protein SlyX